jgi:TPR repeat protein
LGRFYERGEYGFKRNIKKAHKWLAKAQSKPSHEIIDSVGDTILEGDQMSESVLLFGTGAPEAIENYGLERDRFSLSTATMSSSSKYSSSAGSSLHEQCPFDELGTAAFSVCQRCDKCSGKSPLCQACKVIGSYGGGGKSVT